MSLERKCKNCEIFNQWCFAPNEELVRQDERNKIIKLLKSDLENFDGLADDCVERKDIHELLQNNAVRKYIEETIVLLVREE